MVHYFQRQLAGGYPLAHRSHDSAASAVASGQRSVAAFSDRHVVECQGLFAKEEKKANVREIVRDIMAGVVPGGQSRIRASFQSSNFLG